MPLSQLERRDASLHSSSEAMGAASVPAWRRRRREGDSSSNKQQQGGGAERSPATALLKGERARKPPSLRRNGTPTGVSGVLQRLSCCKIKANARMARRSEGVSRWRWCAHYTRVGCGPLPGFWVGYTPQSVRCLRFACAGAQTKFREVLAADPSLEQRGDALMGLVSELVVPTDAEVCELGNIVPVAPA